MKVIDLLNKIANGEEVPEKIKIHDTEYHKCILKAGIDYKIYSDDFYYLSNDICKAGFSLNDEVEIIEEPQEHKIPEKIFLNQTYGNCYIDIYSYKQVPFKREKLSPEEISIINKINEIIDYLEVNNDRKR